MFDKILDGSTDAERDRVLNTETRRALTRIANLVSMAIIGLLVAVALLSLPALTAIFSASWPVHLGVTVIVAVALPVVVPYVMLRVYGLTHRGVVRVAKQAGREATAEAVALRGSATAASVFAEQEASEGIGNGSLTLDGDEAENESEDRENAERTEKPDTKTSNADEAADTATRHETASQ